MAKLPTPKQCICKSLKPGEFIKTYQKKNCWICATCKEAIISGISESEKQLTALQENAAKLFVEGNTQSDAYRKAGYNTNNMLDKTVNEEASRLFANPKISARVIQLQQEHAKRHNVTVDSLTSEYNEIKILAMAEKDYSPAVSAVNGKAKIHGLDKLIIEGDLKMVKIKDMTGKK